MQLTLIKTALTSYSIDQDGLKQGKQQNFEVDGTLKEEINWTNDELDGDHTIWYDGRITYMKPYKMGVLDGVEINWNTRTTWVNGVKHGPFKDSSNDYPEHGTYKDGKLDGPHYKKDVGNHYPHEHRNFYKDGLKHGECISICGSNMLKDSGVYIDGQKAYDDSEQYQLAVAMGEEINIVPLQESYGQYLEKDNSVLIQQRKNLHVRTVNAIQKQVKDAVSNINTQNSNITIVVHI